MEIDMGAGTKIVVTKDFSAMFIVITDIVAVCVFVLFIIILERKKNQYEQLYKDYMI